MRNLSDKQQLFAFYYVGECMGNAEKSALKAGYKPSFARARAYKLLENSRIQKLIEEINRQVIGEKLATVNEIQSFWSEVIGIQERRLKID